MSEEVMWWFGGLVLLSFITGTLAVARALRLSQDVGTEEVDLRSDRKFVVCIAISAALCAASLILVVIDLF